MGSHHDHAMAPATDETVLGDFDDATFSNCGVTTRFFREDGRFLIGTEGPGGDPGTFEVRYTFGFDPLQQYLVAMPGGRYQSFTVAWDTRARGWFSLYGDECVGPDEWLHWTNAGMNWNYMCADCHSTNLERNFRLESATYETTYSEVDVSCEACHGPGERHVEWAEGDGAGHAGGEVGVRPGTYGLTTDLSSQSPQIESCAPCHSRRRSVYPDYVPGRAYLDHFEPELLHDELYYPDGQIKDEVYVYGSFLQSRMYREGVRCSDCHDPHSTRLKLDGNALCTQCHEPETYDAFEHVRHEPGVDGSRCVDCHMPQRTYMVVDPRRDHSFTIPRPDLTAELGVPNACTGCHEGETPQWAATAIAEWHGPDRAGDASVARTIAHARAGADGAQGERSERGEQNAEEDLIELVGDRGKPGIVRATAMFLLRGYGSAASFDAAREALTDPDPLVRVNAVRKVEGLSETELVALLRPVLEDSVRLVRMEAAGILARTGAGRTPDTSERLDSDAFREALEEYRLGQLALSDQPAAHLNLATIHEGLNEFHEAEAAYRTALRLDSSFVPAHVNLAMLYTRRRDESGRPATESDSLYDLAEEELRRALHFQPDLAAAHYSLGLLLAEKEDGLEEAIPHLTKAAELSPLDARRQYNAGLALQRSNRRSEAEVLLRKASELEPSDPDFLNALSIYYAQEERWPEALDYTERLAAEVGENEVVQERLSYIRARRGR